ncbi:hypothetical protein GSI_13732 [Ganoderma sinense ZZ0214-1]|uniref:Mitochondrial outer membrane transport complex Sam37/metaxin N-terminal domain-containing protein n=1 Tax=Ganoderma sinense ZZ0214-1 TaxID=1077348 RepID=A0A2G8RR65_9APHY|nr:hypothetical protein GSI_13732 [Ganoderma sinense ZZ0214-1]
MSESKPSGPRNITLHIWPKLADSLAFDVASVAALFCLQLAIPGQFAISYCANPDSSPSGQLPFLTHGLHHVSGLAPIAAYVRKLHNARNLDAPLDTVQMSQLTARVAHLESSYGDLVNHMLYSLQENWSGVTGPALVSMLPVPQRYYVPLRIRTSNKARLEAAELWHVPEVEDEPEEPRRVLGRRKKRHPPNEPHKFKPAFERQKVVEKARALFDVYHRLLGSNQFFLGSALPTTLDVVFAAHTHLLLKIAFPDPLVSSVLTESYPRFVTHHDAVFRASFSNPTRLPPVIEKTWTSSLRYLIPWPRVPVRRKSPSSVLAESPEVQQEEWRYKLWRWGFIGASVVAATAYLLYTTRNLTVVLKDRKSPPRLASLPTPPPSPEEIPDAEESSEGSEDEQKAEEE